MLAYGQSKLEYQAIQVEMPIQNPHEEEKFPSEGARGDSTEQVNQKLTQLANQVELHMEILLTTEGYHDDIK